MVSTHSPEVRQIEVRLRERAEQLRREVQQALQRSSDEPHVRISEQARDREDDSFANLVVDVTYSEADRDAEELRRIDAALRRISDGTYGICEMCGQDIPLPRLQAEPTALRCIRCQDLFEKTYTSSEVPRL